MLAMVRAVLGLLAGDARAVFVGRVVDSVFAADKSATFDAFAKLISKSELTLAQRAFLFERSCELLDATYIPGRLIEAFEKTCGGAVHYSQEGEDIILERLFGPKQNGFFVDVGAHHATRFSNTYALYRKGWRGMNIDATPGSMESFKRLRPDDINLEVAVSDRQEPLVFSMFKEGALNTFDKELAQSYIDDSWELGGMIELVPRTLVDVFDEYIPSGQHIDFLSIDVEGEDLSVLRSNDWEKYCPDVIVIEVLDTPLVSLKEHPAIAFLAERGFFPIARLFNSVILNRESRQYAGC
jgi:FkbM family methyltransferase